MLIDGSGDLDNFGGAYGDSPDYTFDRAETHIRVDYTVADPFGFDGQSRLTFTSSENDRHYSNDNPDYPPLVESSYNGRLDTLTWHSVLELGRGTLAFGLEHTRETGESDYESDGYVDQFERRHVGTDSLYVTGFTDWLGCQWNAGLRMDDHDTFGNKTTGSIGIVKLFPDAGLRLRFHGGTAFKAPSLYQLYSPYGSVALTPEESRTMEIGLEKSLMEDRLLVSLTWFDSRYDDMIDFDPDTWTYINVAEAAIRGSEIAFQYRQHDTGWRLAYNFYHTEDRLTGEPLLRRPRATLTGAFHTRWNRLGCHLALTYNTSREDFDYSAWPASRVELDPFILLDVAFNYRVRENMEIVFRGQNITDETYELVKGYGTPGSTWYAGIRLTMQR